jgi:hypothetical protein
MNKLQMELDSAVKSSRVGSPSGSGEIEKAKRLGGYKARMSGSWKADN